MDSLASLYKNHIVTLQERTRDVLARFKLDALLIHSGELMNTFLDDHAYPFKVNPQFKAWVPVTQVPNCWLLVDGVNKPKLWFYLPVDYWHNVEPLPTSFWTEEIEVIALPKADGIGGQLPAARGNIAYIGPVPERALSLDIAADKLNPKGVLDYLHYYRAYKTDYELYCMREAQKTAVNGHRAAHEAFQSGMSEFDINQAYLTATGHRDTDVPYSNIVALNEHASVLHYTKLDHQVPSEMRSFLLDAGAEYNGYAADLTRTWAANADTDFAQLIKDVNDEQLALMDDWNVRTHTASGLVERVKASTMGDREAELATLEFLKQWVPAGKSPICGNSIGQDRRFLFKHMPELEAYFHYRYLDVSTLKELARRWKPEILDGFTKQGTHQAMDDIRESVAELAYYREHFIKL